jgi:hypothetical protein
MQKKGIKIDLSVMDEAKKGMAIVKKAYANGVWNQLDRLPNNVAEIISEAKATLMEASAGQAMAIENARKVATMAKELGIATPKEMDDIFKDKDYDDLVSGFSKDVDKVIAAAQKNS